MSHLSRVETKVFFSHDHLADMKRLGLALGRVAFHAPDAHQSVERVGSKPRATRLRRKVPQQKLHLLLRRGSRKWNKEVGLAQIAFVLGDLVLGDEMIAKGVPGELGDHPMVLVQIVAVVAQNEIGILGFLELLEKILDVGAHVRKKTLAKTLHGDPGFTGCGEKIASAGPGFDLALGGGRENDPVNARSRVLGEHAEHGAATTDLDVVAVSAQA